MPGWKGRLAVASGSEHRRPWLEVDPAPAVEVIDHPANHDSDLLDDFAIAALQGLLACPVRGTWDSVIPSESAAKEAYKFARAMMAERAKHQPK